MGNTDKQSVEITSNQPHWQFNLSYPFLIFLSFKICNCYLLLTQRLLFIYLLSQQLGRKWKV